MGLYKNLGYVTAFSYLRSFHTPYGLVESLISRNGKIIDLGCGYGFFSNMLGIASPERNVTGIELNKRKIQYASRGIKNVQFFKEDITKLKLDACDAVVFFHVLHHLKSYEEQYSLISECSKRLKSGGKLIVVEIDYKPFWKFLVTFLIDSTLYLGDRIYYRSRKEFESLFMEIGFRVESIVPAHKCVPLSHVIYVCEKL
jgi:2-polyprenyl-3-methyl-5-hydroxy-6-metoxy-1,4-benzoquinol methylase